MEAGRDNPLPIPANQTISAPHMVLMMLAKEALDLQVGDIVLEIGTGSGYNAAIISCLIGENGKLYTIERHAELVKFSRNNLMKQDLFDNIEILHGDGTKILLDVKFDKIIVTAAGPFIPDTLLDQLKHDGILVIPVQSRIYDTLLKVRHSQSNFSGDEFLQSDSLYFGKISVTDLGNVRFVPLIGKYGHKR